MHDAGFGGKISPRENSFRAGSGYGFNVRLALFITPLYVAVIETTV